VGRAVALGGIGVAVNGTAVSVALTDVAVAGMEIGDAVAVDPLGGGVVVGTRVAVAGRLVAGPLAAVGVLVGQVACVVAGGLLLPPGPVGVTVGGATGRGGRGVTVGRPGRAVGGMVAGDTGDGSPPVALGRAAAVGQAPAVGWVVSAGAAVGWVVSAGAAVASLVAAGVALADSGVGLWVAVSMVTSMALMLWVSGSNVPVQTAMAPMIGCP